ncbi:type II and III secretion system protein family protein [Lichenibacterium dinghuense]|uniref:type II and III secretion system protein family protein n=1 Tax=Lichenibacterium dinghuense TaxID=2895977 RepID=UPI001F45E9CD|nr:type II and III secretion system protein family protein [Lichenibacterium sp. 6Y81]
MIRAVPRRSAAGVLALAALAAPVPMPAAAQTPVLVPRVKSAASIPAPNVLKILPGARTQNLTMPVGKSIIVDLPEDAAEIFVGKPEVANATVRSPRRLYVMALSKGPTTIFALDKDGRQVAILSINVNDRDVGALEGILRTVLPDDDVRVQAVDDSVILTGTVASAVDAQRAMDIATAFTGYTAVGTGGTTGGGGTGGVSVSAGTPLVVPGRIINSLIIRGQDQVTLKVSIVEVRRDVVKQLGVDLTGAWRSTAAAAATDGVLSSANSSVGNAATLNYLGQRNSLSATLRAFESTGVAHVLAEPNVTAVSGETAKFQAGGTIPILQAATTVTTAFGIPTCTYVQQQYGVSLNFTPTVLSGGRISLHISTQVVEVDPNVATPATNACGSIPGFRQRQNETTVELPSGGSLASAGLVQQTSQQTLSGTPGLFNLPILGALFRSRQYQRNETEMMIVVTPVIARTLRPDQVSKPDDGFTDPTDPQAILLGRMNRIYSRADNPALAKQYRGRVGFIND